MSYGRIGLASPHACVRSCADVLHADFCFCHECDSCGFDAEQDYHLNANGYALTHSDLMIASGRPHQPANFSNGTVKLLEHTFAFPERTANIVAEGNFKASVYCPKVNNWGCHGESQAGTDGNSTCLGCAGAVSVTVAGAGAYVAAGDHDDCACSDSGAVTTPPPVYHAVAANAVFYTPENNCTGGGSCSSAHQTNCDTNCACNSAGVASGPTACECTCKTNRCNTMNQNHTITANSGAPPGQNCSCSSSGVASGASQCGCSCTATTYSCSCSRLTCGSQVSPDGKTFKSTGGTSKFGGGTCKVTATCSGGFYDGEVYAAYQTPGNVHPELFLTRPEDGIAPQASAHLGGSTPTFADGVFTFGSLKVQNLATVQKRLTLRVHAGSSSTKRLSSEPSAPFAAWPTKFNVVQTADTTKAYYLTDEIKVNPLGFADIGNYTLYLLDKDDGIIREGDLSGFNATVKVITGRNYDSSYCSRMHLYPATNSITDLSSSPRNRNDLVVMNRDDGTHVPISGNILTKDAASHGMRFGLHLYNQVGKCFGIVVEMESITQSTKYLTMRTSYWQRYVTVVPGQIVVSHGPEKTLFDATNYPAPYVVQVDGRGANASNLNQEGLPNPLHIVFRDGGGNVLQHATCDDCVIARVVRCTDSTAKASSASSSTVMYPTCSSVTQADCAGSANSLCTSSDSENYLDTLTGTTKVNMVNGTATFTDIQLSFVVGSGYKLQFTHNAHGSLTSRALSKSTDNWADSQVDFPSPATSPNNSFFVRPYELGIGNQIGGDGVDKNKDNSADGVGNGVPFRQQPFVYLKGNGYNFYSSSNQHGWTPVYASLATCAGVPCDRQSIKFFGGTTPPVWNYKTQTGNAGSLTYSNALTYQASVHATRKSGKVGMWWSDLQIDLATEADWLNDVVLEFRVGPGGPDESRKHSTYILSDAFDVFSFPDPPRNLRVHTYDELGFRVEFDPAPSSPAQPLTGFLIEVDVCLQDAHRCSRRGTAASGVCKADRELNRSGHCFNADEGLGRDDEGLGFEPAQVNSRYALELGLGSDLTTGGGHTEDITVNYTATAATKTAASPGGFAAAHFKMRPSRTLYAGDELFLDFGKSYKFSPLDEFVSGDFEGPDGSKLEVSSSTNSSLTLRVKAGEVLRAGRPVSFIAAESAKIKIPPQSLTGVSAENEATPLSIFHAPVLGNASSSRGDNCKGNIGNTTAGCVVKTTYVFPALQDASAMDAEWTGALNSGGSWWKPVDNYRSYVSAGSSFVANDAQCMSGQNPSTTNPQCALSIGTDWAMGVTVDLDWSPPRFNETMPGIASSPMIVVSFTRDRGLASGDRIEVLVPGLVAKTESLCKVSENLTFWSIKNVSTECERLVTEVADAGKPWRSTFDPETSILHITVGDAVVANTPIKITVHGFLAADAVQNVPSPGAVDAKVYSGRRTTFIFKNNSDVMTYSAYAYHPTGTQVRTDSSNKPLKINIEVGAIHSFRVYAFNGRFKSAATTTKVQNRAITRPKPPTHFTQIKQGALGLEMRFTNLMEASSYLESETKPSAKSPMAAELGGPTRIGIRFTPQIDLLSNSIITVPLPKFTGASTYFTFSNSGGTKMFQDVYDVDGAVTFTLNSSLSESNKTLPWAHGCKCEEGGKVVTPRTKFRVTRMAFGSAEGAENYTSTGWMDDEITGLPSLASQNRSIPAKQCGGCSCSDEGTPTTPPTIYNTTGNCTSCKCSKDGVSSHIAPYQVVKKPDEDDSVVAGVCANCTCSDTGGISTGTNLGNCSRCMCAAMSCNCACPIFRKCNCGCETYEKYKCGCRQTKPTDIFSSALWSQSDGEEALMLTVAKGKTLLKGEQQTVWIGQNVGMKKPLNVLDFEKTFKFFDSTQVWGHRNEAPLEQMKLNWVSPFPTINEPRLGYVAQFTTDYTWKTSIRSVYFPDDLAQGLAFPEAFTTLRAEASNKDRSINLTEAVEWVQRGQHILVDQEIMQVMSSKGNILDVVRGRYGTEAVSHAKLASVSVVQMGATDISVDGGISLLAPTADSTAYPLGARLFSSGEIVSGETPEVSIVSACGGNTTTCSKGCKCSDSQGPALGAEFGSVRSRGATKPAIPSDVLSYPKDFRGRLKLAMDEVTTNLILSDQPLDLIGLYMEVALLTDRYIRVDDEIMKVIGANAQKDGKGVVSVSVYSSGGGAHCTCTMAGVIGTTNTELGTTGCYCSAENPVKQTNYGQGINCTAAGTLVAKDGSGGGGIGFAASFTVGSGSIQTITVTDPGIGYRFAPDLIINTGGQTDAQWPCAVNFFSTMSVEKAKDGPQAAKVLRAQLGTAAAAHNAASRVSGVQWAGSEDVFVKKPTKRYNFRIAAYNSAGFSPFVYYDLSLRSKLGETNKLLPQGNQVLELTLLGGGVEQNPSNLTVHFVSPVDVFDISKGKECTSVAILDRAGTSLTCRTPSWVGSKFDVVVTWESGVFKNFDVGSSWVGYLKPEIASIAPAQLDLIEPKVPVIIIVTGNNFGFDSADVTGMLEGPSFTVEKGYELGGLPCSPLVVMSDKLIQCTLTLKSKEEKMVGNIVITAGKNDPQKSEKSPKTTEIKEKPQPVKVEASVQADFTEVTSTPAAKAAFEATFSVETAAALGMPVHLIEIVELLAGSVVVVFNILPDTSSATAVSPAALAVNLAQQAADPNSALRQGSLTGKMTVSLPPGTAELAAATARTTVTATVMAQYLSKSVPRSYSAWDMEICYDTCTYLCETGTEVPQMGGQDVLPGYRAQVCQSECMVHCGYARPISQ